MATKTDALVLAENPGIPTGWHLVEGFPGLWHTEIAVPCERAAELIAAHGSRQAEAREAWDEFEAQQEADGKRQHGREPFPASPCPLKLVRLSEREAEAALDAYAEARGVAHAALREERKAARAGDEEAAAYVHNEEEALAGAEEG